MTEIRFKAFSEQKKVLKSEHRVIGAFAGKRGGKTEVGAIKSILYQENKPNPNKSTIDPYLGVILAPTFPMLESLSWKKFLAYAEPFIKKKWESPKIVEWHDGSEIYGLSSDKPERLEGKKVNWAWLDEVFQMNRQTYLEMQARVSDTLGYLLMTGSLGVQYINPRSHWVYTDVRQSKDPNVFCVEWPTAKNPHFPQQELERLKTFLDHASYNAMFEINWDTAAQNAVYNEWNNENEKLSAVFDPELPTFVSIDWGWAHPMACLFIQYDQYSGNVYIIDEIVESHLKLEQLLERIRAKGYPIYRWFCDIAGNQEREQTGISNVKWFEEKGIELEFRSSSILYGISLVRRYIRRFDGTRHLFVNPDKCPKLIETIKNYRYAEKDGQIVNENPIKENDDAVDSLRYFFINYLDDDLDQTITVRPR